MSILNSKINDLKKMIDASTDNIAHNISKNLFDDVDELLIHRHKLITELIELHSVEMCKKDLIEYLDALRKRDYNLVQLLKHDRDQVKNSLINLGKTKKYLVD